jgi:hypothetical protein
VRKSIVALLFALAIAAAPAAHADADADYLATLARHGVTGDPGALVGAAHDTCDAMAQGYIGSGFAIWKATADYMGQGLSKQQADQAEFVAIDVYCPNYGHWS